MLLQTAFLRTATNCEALHRLATPRQTTAFTEIVVFLGKEQLVVQGGRCCCLYNQKSRSGRRVGGCLSAGWLAGWRAAGAQAGSAGLRRTAAGAAEPARQDEATLASYMY